MKSVSIHSYWTFGTCVRFLQDRKQHHSIKGGGYVAANLSRLIAMINDLQLDVTLNTAAFKELRATLSEFEAADDDAKLTATQATKLKDSIKDLRKTLEAEMKGYEAYVLSPKRYDLKKMMGNVGELFSSGTYQSLSQIARNDFSEAAKCLAMERPTATAFHLMRGTEAVLRDFYHDAVKQNRVKPLMWANMVVHMRTKAKLKAKKTLLDHLDNIRFNFRNPTQHPEAEYTIAGAEDLFGVCIDVVNRMRS